MPSLTHADFPIISFQELGVKGVPIMLLIRNWPIAMNNVFQELKTRICGEIDLIKNQKVQQFENIVKMSLEAYKQIRSISHNLGKPNYSQKNMLSQIPNFLALQQIRSFNFLQIPKTTNYFQKNLIPTLKQTCQLIQSTGVLYDYEKVETKQQV